MIQLCGAACSIGAMTFAEAWTTPLAKLYQIQHFALAYNGTVCRWAQRSYELAAPIAEQQQQAAEAWQRVVDSLATER